MVPGRRGQAAFFLWAGQKLLGLNLLLIPCCLIYLFCSYFGEISHYNAPLAQQLAPLLSRPGFPWSASFLAYAAALPALLAASASLRRVRTGWRDDQLTLRQVRRPLFFCLLAAAAFFAALLLLRWPFAGLPQGLAWEQAIPAIFRHAARAYFMAFTPAGAVCLLALYAWVRQLDTDHLPVAVRYFSFWAAAGLLPHWLITWGMRLGMGVQSQGAVAQGMAGRDPALICLTLALFCWLFLLWKPQYWRSLGIIAFVLFVVRSLWPFFKAFA